MSPKQNQSRNESPSTAAKRSLLSSLAMASTFFVLTAGITVAFQNCGTSGFDSASLKVSQLSLAAQTYVAQADLAWSTKVNAPTVNRFGRVESWKDAGNLGFNLYPPFRPNSDSLNTDISPTLVSDTGGSFLTFGVSENISPSTGDISKLVSDKFTMIMVVRNLVVPTTGDQYLRMFNFYPSNGETAGYLVIDVVQDATNYIFHVMTYMDGNNYTYRVLRVAKGRMASTFVIAMRYGKDGTDVNASINGEPMSTEIVTVGSPGQLGSLNRKLILHSVPERGGDTGTYDLGEVLFFKYGATDGEVQSMANAFACRWGAGPCDGTISNGGGTTIPAASTGAQLYAANCAGCHGTLSGSEKRGITLDRLNTAISTNSSMNVLSYLTALSADDRQKIVTALAN